MGWPAGNSGWFPFEGVIDEASIYSRALNASEVGAIFAADIGGKCPVTATLPPVILSQPADTTVHLGANATFTVTAGGSAPLSYQWQFNGQNLANSAHIVGATSNVLTIVNAGFSDAGSYRVVISNAAGSISSFLVGLSLFESCAPAPPGLMAWYKAEGNALDSADAHHGTFMNGAFVGPGKVGLGFSLFGEGDFVALPPNLFPYPTSGSGNVPFSFETWFVTAVGGVILGQQNTTPFTTPSAYVPAVYVGTDGKLYVSMFWDGFSRISISPGRVNDAIFHHVAVTYDGTTETVYLDGTVIGSQPFTQLGYAANYQYQLGTGYTAGLWPAANNGWFSFTGVIDEASIYNRALSASEVSAIVVAGSSGKCSVGGALAPQLMDEAAGQ